MAASGNRVDPARAEKMMQAAAAAKEEILNRSTVDALLQVAPEDIIHHNPEAEVVKGTAHRSGGWLHAPAHLELFAAADRRLTRVANWAGLNVKRVERVHPKLVKGTKLLILQPAASEDLTALPVHRYAGSSSIWVNLIHLLGDAGLALETGYRERYHAAYVPKDSPLWPGLVIDLSQPQERRIERDFKKRKDPAEPAGAGAEARE